MSDTKVIDTPVNAPKCPECGTPLPTGALAGLCPACLLKLGSAADTVSDGKQPPFNPPPIAELAPLFPQLEILELIGKGGMGAVYKARQKQLERVVALKILPPGIGDDPAFAERFAREAKALAKLNHPGIVTLYEFGQVGSRQGNEADRSPATMNPPPHVVGYEIYFFLMEFVDGVNLRQLLHASRVSPREALAIVPQICDALQFAHDQGIVHRDIKPENILLDRRGRVKVADFGLAKIVGNDAPLSPSLSPSDGERVAKPGEGTPVLTDAGKVMGTPQYMAPEQVSHPAEVDHRADIYALGVVFYQMLTGELPGKPLQPPSRKVQIDVRLDEVVLRALEKKPELRYQQASVLKTRVETIAATQSPGSSRREEAQTESETEQRSHWMTWFPGRSKEERGICAHLTAAERNKMGWLMLLFLPGNMVLFIVLIAFVDNFKGKMGNVAFSCVFVLLIALLVGWLSLWRWKSRQLLCSTTRKTFDGASNAALGARALAETKSFGKWAFGLFLLGTLAPLFLLTVFPQQEATAALFGGAALVLALVLGLMKWRERLGKFAVIGTGLVFGTLIVIAAVSLAVIAPAKRARWKWEQQNVIEGLQSGAQAKAWSDHLRLNQVIAPGESGMGRYGDDDFGYEILFDDKACALTVHYRQEREAEYRLQIEEKGGRRLALIPGVRSILKKGRHDLVEEKKMLDRVEFDRIAALVLQRRAGSQSGPRLSFGPVIERVIPDPLPGSACVLDFETGLLHTPPTNISLSSLAAGVAFDTAPMRWVRDVGGDAVVMPDGALRFLEGVVLKPTIQGRAATWDDLTPDIVASGIAGLSEEERTASAAQPSFYTAASRFPVAMEFTTRERSMGVIQILGGSENPRGVKLRYKLVQKATASTHAHQNDSNAGNANDIVAAISNVPLTYQWRRQDTNLPAAPNLSFGPVIERVVHDTTTGKDCALDLDTGELLSPPPEVRRLFEATNWCNRYTYELGDIRPMRAWAQASGADLVCGAGTDGHKWGLTLLDGESMGAEDYWNMEAARVVKLLREEEALGAGSRVPSSPSLSSDVGVPGNDQIPRSCAFKTKDGSMGVYETTGFTENPRGVKIRYKLVQGAPTQVQGLEAGMWEQRAPSPLRGRAMEVAWTGKELIVFGGTGMGTSFDDGARYDFANDLWRLLPRKGSPSSRYCYPPVWTGKEFIVWGGYGGVDGRNTLYGDGARFNPSSNSWKPISTENAPIARFIHSAVWTGKEMLVWGGYIDPATFYQGCHANAHLNTGGRYNPATDSWQEIPTQGAPSKRINHVAVWTGREMIIWGGANATQTLGNGGRYNPTTDIWKRMSLEGAPSPRAAAVAVWTGKELIVWGGQKDQEYFTDGARYNPETDQWMPISEKNAPQGRVNVQAVWTGTEMMLWGGVNDEDTTNTSDESRYVKTGAHYNPAADVWTPLPTTGAPSGRLTSAVWTGDGLLLFGGFNNVHLNETWFYLPPPKPTRVKTRLKPEQDAASPKFSFSPVVRQKLNLDDTGFTPYLDLDSGKVLSPPSEGVPQIESRHDLPSGVTVSYDCKRNETLLIGTGGTIVAALSRDRWEVMTPDEVEKTTFRDAASSKAKATVKGRGDVPMVFCFKTPLGKSGLLQITGFTEDPRGAYIRYKLVQSALASRTDQTKATPSEIDTKIALLNKKGTTVEEVIRVLGEPERYAWEKNTYEKHNLPANCMLCYKQLGVEVQVMNGNVVALRSLKPGTGFTYRGLHLDSSLDDVVREIGPPAKTVTGETLPWVLSPLLPGPTTPGVLYMDINGRKGFCYYSRPDQNVQFFFGGSSNKNYRVIALLINVPR